MYYFCITQIIFSGFDPRVNWNQFLALLRPFARLLFLLAELVFRHILAENVVIAFENLCNWLSKYPPMYFLNIPNRQCLLSLVEFTTCPSELVELFHVFVQAIECPTELFLIAASLVHGTHRIGYHPFWLKRHLSSAHVPPCARVWSTCEWF